MLASNFLSTAFSLPTVIFTVLLAAVFIYWVIALVGGVGFDLLDGVFDGAAESLDGAGEGFGDGFGDADGDGGGGVLERVGVGTVPTTIVLSLIIVFLWLFSFAGSTIVDSLDLGGGAAVAATGVMLVVALGLSLVASALLARPLSTVFVTSEAQLRSELVGRTCTVRTQRVDDRFGQAEVIDADGASLVVQVRAISDDEHLGLGDEALLVDFDTERDAYVVCSIDQALSP